jgi:hypothetical protein
MLGLWMANVTRLSAIQYYGSVDFPAAPRTFMQATHVKWEFNRSGDVDAPHSNTTRHLPARRPGVELTPGF